MNKDSRLIYSAYKIKRDLSLSDIWEGMDQELYYSLISSSNRYLSIGNSSKKNLGPNTGVCRGIIK